MEKWWKSSCMLDEFKQSLEVGEVLFHSPQKLLLIDKASWSSGSLKKAHGQCTKAAGYLWYCTTVDSLDRSVIRSPAGESKRRGLHWWTMYQDGGSSPSRDAQIGHPRADYGWIIIQKHWLRIVCWLKVKSPWIWKKQSLQPSNLTKPNPSHPGRI